MTSSRILYAIGVGGSILLGVMLAVVSILQIIQIVDFLQYANYTYTQACRYDTFIDPIAACGNYQDNFGLLAFLTPLSLILCPAPLIVAHTMQPPLRPRRQLILLCISLAIIGVAHLSGIVLYNIVM